MESRVRFLPPWSLFVRQGGHNAAKCNAAGTVCVWAWSHSYSCALTRMIEDDGVAREYVHVRVIARLKQLPYNPFAVKSGDSRKEKEEEKRM